MAKSLKERIASARSTDRVTIETLEQLVGDIEAERERLSAAHERASAESIDYALGEDDRDDAAAKAAKYARDIAGLAQIIPELADKLERKRESDTQRAKRAEAQSALQERDEIAARFAERVPAITAELIELIQAVNANAERMRLAGVYEANAEWHARGIPGNGMIGVSHVEPFVKIKIPNFDGPGRAWPIDHTQAMAAQIAADSSRIRAQQMAAVKRREQEKREAAEEHRRTHGIYRLSTSFDGRPIRLPVDLVSGAMPSTVGNWQQWEGEVAHAVAEELRSIPHLNVEAMGGEQEQ
ncbi:hypothetical protein ABC955_10330 [Citromicrobium bathyomarinum]